MNTNPTSTSNSTFQYNTHPPRTIELSCSCGLWLDGHCDDVIKIYDAHECRGEPDTARAKPLPERPFTMPVYGDPVYGGNITYTDRTDPNPVSLDGAPTRSADKPASFKATIADAEIPE